MPSPPPPPPLAAKAGAAAVKSLASGSAVVCWTLASDSGSGKISGTPDDGGGSIVSAPRIAPAASSKAATVSELPSPPPSVAAIEGSTYIAASCPGY